MATSRVGSKGLRVDREHARVVSATRLHLPPDACGIPDVTRQHLIEYLHASQRLGVTVAIAVNAHEDAVRSIAEEVVPNYSVHVLPVPFWGAFVPALNALLGFAQRKGMRYILYQSLEVLCTPDVLQLLLAHHTRDTLVVGPVLAGHTFLPGEQKLNGRTAPWNTLAVWSVRKLALTGFLSIADGISPAEALATNNPQEATDDEDSDSDSGTITMGCSKWWNADNGMMRQGSAIPDHVPAGVEEVTAIAVLQHLLGMDRARAILVKPSRYLSDQVSWAADWGKDARRAAWHQYKMASKITRPHMQLKQLFGDRSNQAKPIPSLVSSLSSPSLLRRRRAHSSESLVSEDAKSDVDLTATKPKEQEPAVDADDAQDAENLKFGTVMHYGESIPPPDCIRRICLASFMLFYANSTAVLASAFRYTNDAPQSGGMIFAGLLIGGVYLPMPLSLWLTRTVTVRANHSAGLALFASFLLLAHGLVIVSQLVAESKIQNAVLLLSRLVQGLGSGVLFQARFLMAQVSTSDFHTALQSESFLATDLGLGVGALLPCVASLLGFEVTMKQAPELLNSIVLAIISFMYLCWLSIAFPARLPALSDRIRFGARAFTSSLEDQQLHGYKMIVWLSGTTRVFVQAAIMPVAALSLRDASWTGNFRQSSVVAALCLLPMPFDVLVTRFRCQCMRHRSKDGTETSKVLSGVVGAVALLIAGIHPRSVVGEDGDMLTMLTRIFELGALMIALAMAAPFNASRLYQLKDAERATVMLEWSKAYVGRLLGPIFAVMVYSWVGYGPVLAVLSIATVVVTLTA